MIVRTTAEITDTDRHIKGNNGNWESKRIVLADDRVGFSFHETTIAAGTTNDFHYANHIEAVWLTRGKGTLRDLTNDKEYPLEAGSMYLLDNVIQRYAWGSRTALAELLGRPSPSPEPQVEPEEVTA